MNVSKHNHSEQEVLAAEEQMDENNEPQFPCNHEETHRVADTSMSFLRALPVVVDCSLEVPPSGGPLRHNQILQQANAMHNTHVHISTKQRLQIALPI